MVDRGGLNYPIRVRDEFSKTTAKFREELRSSKTAFRDFQNSLSSNKKAAQQLRSVADESRGVAQAERSRAKSTDDSSTATDKADRFEKKRLRTIRNLRDQTQLLADEEVRLARDSQRVAASSEKAASAVEKKAQAEKAAAKAAIEAAKAEQRLVDLRNQQAQSARGAGEQAQAQNRSRELAQLRGDIEARAEAQQSEETAAKNLADLKAKQAKDSAVAGERASQQQRDRELAQLQASIKARAAAEQAETRANDVERKQRERNDPRLAAQKQLNAELFKQQVIEQKILLLRDRAKLQFAEKDFLGGNKTLKQARDLEKSLQGTVKAGNNLFFTFRRLVGTLAIFTLARRGVQVFNDLIAGGLKFNDTIEASTIGIAGLVATLGDVRNDLGQSVSSAEELELALGLAREQIGKLRQDSLRTVATFEQLLDTFQIAVGPGLAAGLNLDEIRQLTVDISQAASALGVPQNQLAEEVRSLLSGTIQARTTRIATALGITNEDIRTLKETGELFDFLEERFAGFATAAEKQARETLDGIRTLVTGIVQETLGQAAQPLFEELLALGNELFDEVLTVRDELGNLKPNPEIVEAFQAIFDALRDGVREARSFGESLGFEGLQAALGGAAIVLQAIIGFLGVFVRLTADILSLITLVKDELGFVSDESGNAGREFGAWAARIFAALQITKLLNKELLKSVRGPAILVAAFAAIGKALEFILEKVFSVDLNLRETVQLITLGLFGSFLKVAELIDVIGTKISASIGNAIRATTAKAKDEALAARSFVASLFGNEDEAVRLEQQREADRLAFENSLRKNRTDTENEVARIRAEAAAKQMAVEEEIGKVVGNAAAREAQGPGFVAGFDPQKAAEDAANAAKTFVSTADKPINELGESLFKVNDELRKARLEFALAGRSAAQGFGGQVAGVFGQEEIANAERLRKIRTELALVEEKIGMLRMAGVQDGEGALVSALRDEADLRDAILQAERTSLDLAVAKSATLAANLLPSLREELTLLQAQAAGERAVTSARVNGLGARQQAIIAAQAAVDLARVEADLARQKAAADAQALQTAIGQAEPGAEQDALQATLDALRERADIEQEILGLKTAQLEKTLQEADLLANGSFSQGVRRGLEELRDELPTIFEAGLELTKQAVTGFADFAATEIVSAIVNAQQDGVNESALFRTAAAQFAQELATQILQTVVNNLIQTLLQSVLGQTAVEITAATTASTIRVTGAQTAAAIEIAAAQTAAAIRSASAGFGFHDGGLVQGFNAGGFVNGMAAHFSSMAVGLARGGRPPGIHPSDTVPAWLTPGEFVMSRGAVRALGLHNLEMMNGGNMPVMGSASAEAAGPSLGMQTGGLVADRQQSAQNAAPSRSGGDTILPVLVAKDREMDQLTAGGRNAFFQFMREEAGNINTLLDRSAGRR